MPAASADGNAGENAFAHVVVFLIIPSSLSEIQRRSVKCLLRNKRQMRAARPQRYAGDYAVPGSFQLTLQRDIYLYSRTTRVKRQTTQNGDSFHGGGSSTHRSSSGSSHGGSHGKF